jgi:hypothetical protein
MKKIAILSLLVFSFCGVFAQAPLYRYYNPKSLQHYYTVDFSEYRNGNQDWASEGASCMVFTFKDRAQGTVPVFRYFNPTTGDHYYTTRREFPAGALNGYNFEGNKFFIFPTQIGASIPLLEYFNPSTGAHFYTTDKRELGRGFDGYAFSAIVGYVFRK